MSSLLSLLDSRRLRGVVGPTNGRTRGPSLADCRKSKDVRVEDLASAVAWNPRRMQNTMLCVGPGTPASTLIIPNINFSSSSSEDDDEAMPLPSDISEGSEDEDGEGEGGAARESRRQRWTRRVMQSVHIDDDAQMNELLEENEGGAEAEADDKQGGERESTAGTRQQRLDLDSARSEQSDSGAVESPSIDRTRSHSMADQSTGASSRNTVAATIDRPIAPSMRHSGCVNTAAWLSCPWRLSLVNHSDNTLHSGFIQSSSHSSNSAPAFSSSGHSSPTRERLYSSDRNEESFGEEPISSSIFTLSTDEIPTQVITSGDDRIVKFWDVSNAMGGISPWAGGPSTFCPFSEHSFVETPKEVVTSWKERRIRGDPIPGTVTPLISLQTSHSGNVFHATPIYHQPGKVATCAADGFMRVCDIEAPSSSSTIVVSPDVDEDAGDMPLGFLRLRSGMCFSHHFLDANTGLLCTEVGLKRFDLRLSPREQPSGSVLGGQYSSSKSCAIWSSGSDRGTEEDFYDSAYVFAGSSSGDVALCDLRMTSDTTSRIVQHYRPRCFGPYEAVSVSGIDVSRDKRELLVSYESDQIYSFPIFDKSASAAGPSVDELAEYSAALAPSCTDDDEDGTDSGLLPELAAYGGHLNRFTFLKVAKYAGPNDEYICTGSDSGHAWIYEKKSGAVVSLLKADHSTCNGIIPHPTLPFFLTYGIDSTAKLWRATQPVSDEIDDSDLGRTNAFHKTDYEASYLVKSWRAAQDKLDLFCEEDIENISLTLLPDEVPSQDEDDDGLFGGLAGLLFRSPGRSVQIPYIRNDLIALPRVLLNNYFSYVRAIITGDEEPIKSGIDPFKRRLGLMRLKYQADRLGLKLDPMMPWAMEAKHHVRQIEAMTLNDSDNDKDEEIICPENKYASNVDLVPDFPADWIPFDVTMTPDPLACGMDFNKSDYEDFYMERYASRRGESSLQANPQQTTSDNLLKEDDFLLNNGTKDAAAEESESGIRPKSDAKSLQNVKNKGGSNPSSGDNDVPSPYDAARAWDLLYDTIVVLKEGGNAALSAGLVPLAAHRYDKALRYCAMAFMRFPEGRLSFLSSHQDALTDNGGYEVRWSSLIKILTTVRLNLSMTMLLPEAYSPIGACNQANMALLELRPFATTKGKVMTGEKLDKERNNEPESTYTEAKELQAKAYFRLGNAQTAASDHAGAIKSFESSIKSTKDLRGPNAKPDAVVQRRLAEAKKEFSKKRKRQRKKFKFAFSEGEEEAPSDENVGKAETKESDVELAEAKGEDE